MAEFSSIESEIESVKAIFPDVVEVIDKQSRICVVFAPDARVYVHLHANSHPIFEVCAPSMPGQFKTYMLNQLRNVYAEHPDQPVLYGIVEKALELYYERSIPQPLNDSVFQIFSGPILEDRKSIFQAHVAAVDSKEEAMAVLAQLKSNSKIARATHNIYAWKVERANANGKKIDMHDCEDDGEFGAGPKLLKILSMMKVKNLIVIVTRWYGGKHLGPDRFRHICNLARAVIVESVNERILQPICGGNYEEDEQQEDEKKETEEERPSKKAEQKMRAAIKKNLRPVKEATPERVVELLRELRAKDIVCLKVPINQCTHPHLIICSSQNDRHADAVTQSIRKFSSLTSFIRFV
uniref:Impact N-terminal domain-containing protein n=1 Tax=Ditylenchus dipsaci TaxID=166011 RepID=A0A915D993_9BILA